MMIDSTRKTIGSVLEEAGGIGPGFDTLRLILSVSVMCWHSLPICYGYPFEHAVWISAAGRPFMLIMPIFFGLSGFLVMGSAVRIASLPVFLSARGLRIIPALATELTMSAVVIGGIFTNLPKEVYYTSHGFFEYFGSLVGKVVFQLPGVIFPNNPYSSQINNNLWTIPPELLCYVLLSIIIVIDFYKNRWAVLLTAIIVTLLNIVYDISHGAEAMDARWPARYLVMAFTYGNVAFAWRHHIKFNWTISVISIIIGMFILRTPFAIYFAIACIIYFTLHVGLSKVPSIKMLNRGDYSYGIYLYGFPIQQVVVAVFPWSKHFYLNIFFSVPLALGLAMISWHFVEKPSLLLRKKLNFTNMSGPKSNWTIALTLFFLLSYAAFLLRFSFIAFSKPTSAVVLMQYTWIIIGCVMLCLAGRQALRWLEPQS